LGRAILFRHPQTLVLATGERGGIETWFADKPAA
jgi:hypothetical protein